MTQHIIVVDVLEDGTTVVNPELASVWRDDQVIMWSLASHLKWPEGPGAPPIPIVSKQDWPGGPASPIGDPPKEGPDRRNYMALCGVILPDGTEPVKYTYNIVALQLDDIVYDPKELTWTDPDVENRPLP